MKRSHPDEAALARYAGGEAGQLERFWVERHARRCEACASLIGSYQLDQAWLMEQAGALPELPEGWDLEMRANIRVGLAASAAIRPQPVRQRLNPRAMFAAGALSVLVMAGWFFRDPRGLAGDIGLAWSGQPAVELVESGDGIGWRTKHPGAAVVLLRPEGSSAMSATVYAPRGLQTSYVDQQSGQVTITHVAMD
jgi:hypothetical protein